MNYNSEMRTLLKQNLKSRGWTENRIRRLLKRNAKLRNAALARRRRLRKKKLASRDFSGFLITFQSHLLLPPFIGHVLPRVKGAQYWRILRTLWSELEVMMPDRKQWENLLGRAEPQPEHFMSKKERRLLGELPATLTVFRGFGHSGGEVGFSWTLNRATAVKFGYYACGSRRHYLTRYGGSRPFIAVARVRKLDVFAYLIDRDEAEIIVRKPEAVFDVKMTPLPPKPTS